MERTKKKIEQRTHVFKKWENNDNEANMDNRMNKANKSDEVESLNQRTVFECTEHTHRAHERRDVSLYQEESLSVRQHDDGEKFEINKTKNCLWVE